jgi:uncharacterized protein DUF6966
VSQNALEMALDACALFLAHEGEFEWSRALERLKNQCVATGTDQSSIRDVLRLFGGMGSFSDLVLQKNGKMPVHENAQLDKLRTAIFEAARSMLA